MLAEACGVSTATVSRALAGHHSVRAALRRARLAVRTSG
ncbi:MAG: LacI family DNA-binding transcriptional regulator [Opitutaceae bacterium]